MKKIDKVNPKIFYLELRKNGQIIFEKVKGTTVEGDKFGCYGFYIADEVRYSEGAIINDNGFAFYLYNDIFYKVEVYLPYDKATGIDTVGIGNKIYELEYNEISDLIDEIVELELDNTNIFHEAYERIQKLKKNIKATKDIKDIKTKFNNKTLKAAVKQWLKNKKKAKAKYGHISNWDTSEVTSMSNLFYQAKNFNESIGNWDVSNVKTMKWMFREAFKFNQPIGNWDVSKVKSMEGMFSTQPGYDINMKFNQPIGNWNVSNVKTMKEMFEGANDFNHDISNWDVSKVTNMKMMFSDARAFNQPIGNWDVKKVKDFEYFSDSAPLSETNKPNFV